MSDLTGGKTYRDNEGGKAVFCAEPVSTSFKIDQANWNFPQNCALGLLNVDSVPNSSSSTLNASIDRSKLATFCGACKPGYRAVYGTDNLNEQVNVVITSCELIQNCAESTAFNNCTKCDSGYSFNYIDGEVKYDSCV